mgnify:CR=1 FL=1
MDKKEFEVTVNIDVFDERALLEAAKEKAIDGGMDEDEVEVMFGEEDEDLDIAGMLTFLVDPGMSFPGSQILDSNAESVDIL